MEIHASKPGEDTEHMTGGGGATSPGHRVMGRRTRWATTAPQHLSRRKTMNKNTNHTRN